MPAAPDFRVVTTDGGEGVTYTCGCPCQPTASPGADGSPGFEHCCCGKVHFVGAGAEAALDAYLSDRRSRRPSEPAYERGRGFIALASKDVDLAWAFPLQSAPS